MFLLSFALADRINVTRREKEQAQAATLATEQLMVEALRQSERQLEARERQVRVGASIGLALYPQDGTDPERLFNHADRAMYESKGKPRRVGGGES
jgi:predicted signal transduction protein with EAL and GGDEF domain